MASLRPTKRARKDAPHRSPDEVVDIDPDGDLVLKAGADRSVLMRVSSKHLTIVSKVFKTLLGPKFSEGQSPHEVTNPLVLPDDNGESMILMCRLAHHTVTEVHEIKPKDLEGLILVCDKYGCAASFKFHLHTIMANWLADHKRALSEENTTTTYAGLHILDALCMAYLTQDAECFNELSRYVFGKATTNLIEGKMSKALLAVMPDGFMTGLSDVLQKAIQDAVSQLRFPLDALAQHVLSHSTSPSPVCSASNMKAGKYALMLAHYGWLSTYSVKNYDNIMTRITSHCYSLEKDISKLQACSEKCKYCSFDFGGSIRFAANKAKAHLGYMCIFCVREGSYNRTRSGCAKHKA